jgi:outer membrane protein OmpA-like peptidoglycan-associated protein
MQRPRPMEEHMVGIVFSGWELDMAINKHGLAVLAAALMVSTAASADEVKKEAVIISITEGTISAKTREGPLTVVTTPMTKYRETSGLVNKKTRDASSLMNGLIITVKGDQQGDTVTAESISFRERDWRAAVAAKAGTTEQFANQQSQLSELRQAVIDGQEYVIQDEATVYFKTGSAEVGPIHQRELRSLAEKAPSFGNYRLSILGFADKHGNPAANERLSMKRAEAVSNYLRQTGLIQPGRVLSPSAMGEGTVAPGEQEPGSDEEARRVVVRVVTPKGQLSNDGAQAPTAQTPAGQASPQ